MKTKIKKQWYGKKKNAKELHNDNKFWLSEIGFVKDEMQFLEHLLGLNYIDFLDTGLKENVTDVINEIKEEKNAINKLGLMIQEHDNVIGDLKSSVSLEHNLNYLESHLKLERLMDLYYDKFKTIKRKLFKIVEFVANKKDVKKLI
ncbi:hypothetical protein EGM88_06055 [Aureibaculum marinum]|uniref:Uncharacterized protein n=1 Tax=Aureibaculum marinum TaxID=2487930 RepID=A0A3N4NR11_9FLAO|nr:hypothetical protein [Aureibaculum marinum]RPD98751.1 hypothetical protein EGM88_06055 [Aureibaculum marinum]